MGDYKYLVLCEYKYIVVCQHKSIMLCKCKYLMHYTNKLLVYIHLEYCNRSPRTVRNGAEVQPRADDTPDT